MPEQENIEIEDLRGDLPDDELIANVRRDESSWRDYFGVFVEKSWEESLKLWQAEHLATPRAGRSKLFIQKPRSSVRKIGADLLDAFFSSPDYVTIEPGRPNRPDDVLSARIRQLYLNHIYSGNPINWFKICFSAFDDASVLNMIAAEVSWIKEIDTIDYNEEEPEIDPQTGQAQIDPTTGEPQTRSVPKTVELVVRDEPNIRLIPPDRIALDPRSAWEDIYAGQFIIHKDPVTYQELLKLSEIDLKIDKDNLEAAQTYQRNNTNTVALVRRETSYRFEEPHRKEIEVWKYYYKVMGHWWFAWLNEDKLVLRKPERIQDTHGLPPIMIGFLDPESHKIYSPSKVYQNRDNFVELNGIRNQRMDNVARIMNQHAIVNRDANVDYASLVNRRPMGYTTCEGDPRLAVHYEQVPDIRASAYNEEQIVDRDIQELFGVTELDKGMGTTNKDELLGQSVIRQQNSQKKASVNIRVIAETFIIPLTKRVFQLADQYETAQHLIEIVGADPMVAQFIQTRYARPNDNIPSLFQIKGQYNIKVYAGLGFFSKDQQVQNYERAMRLVLSYGPQAALPMLEEYLTLLGVRNVNEIVQAAQSSLQVQQLLAQFMQKADARKTKGGSPRGNGNEATKRPQNDLTSLVNRMRGRNAPV